MEWQPIETAPIKDFDKKMWFRPHSERMLLWDRFAVIGSYNFTEKGKGRWQTQHGNITPTHWMPLPPAPQDK